MFKLIFCALGGFLAGSIPAGRIGSYIPEAVARFGVRYMDRKKAVAPKKPERPQPERLRQPRRIEKVYRRILMRSAPVSGKK